MAAGGLCRPMPRLLCLALSAGFICFCQAATCPGSFHMAGLGKLELIPTGWNRPGATYVDVNQDKKLVAEMGSRAYFAERCNAGHYDNNDYIAMNLLGKTMKFTTDISAAECGCNAAFYLTNLRQNTHPSECHDYYCDANNVCGQSCAEIDIMEASKRAWHSTLHTKRDHEGQGAGYGGGDGWNGPRDWLSWQYGPGGDCIDTSKPFDVSVSFPVDGRGILHAMDVKLTQTGKSCPLSLRVAQYPGMADLTRALQDGMTPILSYWSSSEMLWMDGKGPDGKGPCWKDTPSACGRHISAWNFSVETIGGSKKDHSHIPNKGQAHQDSVSQKSEKREPPTCPGNFNMDGYGNVSLVPFGWKAADAAKVEMLPKGHRITPHKGSRVYFADRCNAGRYNNTHYLAVKLLGKKVSYTVDLAGAGCGCNVAMYLTSMRWNEDPSECGDYYCDANSVCGEACTEIGIMEANDRAWHSTLHTAYDHSGVTAGYGGGFGWNGPRDWTSKEYAPGSECIDTSKPFQVTASFPTDPSGKLAAMEVVLSQGDKDCNVNLRIANYIGVEELSKALARGMTPTISYWTWDKMFWLDGPGTDGKGPCWKDRPDQCGETVKLSDFKVEDIKMNLKPDEKKELEKQKCHEGWLRHPDCVDSFSYNGKEYEGCTIVSNKKASGGWCSLDPLYKNRWRDCEECDNVESEEEVLHPQDLPPVTVQPPENTASHEEYVPLYQQCGGKAYHGPTKCVPGTDCKMLNDWFGQCLRVEGCVNGWTLAPRCVSEFSYDDDNFVGCKKSKNGKHHWCSWDPKYAGRWSSCTPCTERGAGPSTLVVDVAEDSSIGPSEVVVKKQEDLIIMKKDMLLPNGDRVGLWQYRLAYTPLLVAILFGFMATMTVAMIKWRCSWRARPASITSMSHVALVDALTRVPPEPHSEAADLEVLVA